MGSPHQSPFAPKTRSVDPRVMAAPSPSPRARSVGVRPLGPALSIGAGPPSRAASDARAATPRLKLAIVNHYRVFADALSAVLEMERDIAVIASVQTEEEIAWRG